MKHLIAVPMTVAAMLLHQPAHAALEDELTDLFSDMSNFTSPAVVEGAQRGVVSLGGAYTRSRIADVNLGTFAFPSADAGCGGIDIFGGSFSFINKDQFIQLLRSISANAAGYAFKLALQSLSSMVAGVVGDLESTLRAMNNLTLNSCTTATALVDGFAANPKDPGAALASAWDRVGGPIFGTNTGLSTASDPIEASQGSSSGKLTAAGQNEAYRLGSYGNITWRVLHDQAVIPGGAAAWFRNNDTQFMNVLMSLVGTVVVAPPPAATPDSDPSEAESVGFSAPPLLEVRHIFYGTQALDGTQVRELRRYNCPPYEDSDPTSNPIAACMGSSSTDGISSLPIVQLTGFDGFEARVRRVLLGNGTDGGVVRKWAISPDSVLTPEEMAFVSVNSEYIAPMRNVAAANPGAALSLADQFASAIALQILEELVYGTIDTLRQAAAQNARLKTADMEQAFRDIRDQFIELRVETARTNDTLNNLSALSTAYLKNAAPTRNIPNNRSIVSIDSSGVPLGPTP